MSGPTPFSFDRLPVSRWRNGGGSTREIVSWPGQGEPGTFGWRASIATLDCDGDFSAFPGIDRIITLLEGSGVVLHSAGGISHALIQPGRPHAFAGEDQIHATLVGGPSLDFNIMTRRDAYTAEVRLITGPQLLPADHAGVLYVLAGEWHLAGQMPMTARNGIWWHADAGTLSPYPAVQGGLALWADITARLPDSSA
ncbi:HutD family protein [Acerihabitans sp. TG2]|uniref:HutD/Ves family protein n=1 Tax=Acerihabitans sp. TG2 TaxID=3096008 RepID=UPI002B23AC8A|nr:HutD family protein [Acerihabitans sp. TG2]MEA9391016.1 HutD family protein [Acerihabitans sp. TG2]